MKILILSPHVDDGVLGCGGTISTLSEDPKNEIEYLVFSPKSHQIQHDVLHEELVSSLQCLGLDESNIIYCDFITRFFPRNRQRILDYLYGLKNRKRYDWIFTPSTFDVHQDHETVTQELLRIYKRLPVSIFGYELVLNQFSFNTAVFFGFDNKHMDAKLEAFNCYASQMTRVHFKEDLFHSIATVRGAQMGVNFAEAFQAIRIILNTPTIEGE